MHFLTSLIILAGVNSIAFDDHRPTRFTALSFDVLGYHMRVTIRTVSDLIERRFASYAGVPYQNSLSRRDWEELWETEATP
jgi:hypothetical protein